jgi:hypothetical protein
MYRRCGGWIVEAAKCRHTLDTMLFEQCGDLVSTTVAANDNTCAARGRPGNLCDGERKECGRAHSATHLALGRLDHKLQQRGIALADRFVGAQLLDTFPDGAPRKHVVRGVRTDDDLVRARGGNDGIDAQGQRVGKDPVEGDDEGARPLAQEAVSAFA